MTNSNEHNPDHARIPDELIDAALDGELCDELENEIAHALRYDNEKRAELNATLDAIDALRAEPECPDFQCGVLNTLDSRRTFLSTPMRRMVRAGRLAAAAALLLTLMLVSALQTLSPRFATIAPHATPVDDVASAISEDTRSILGRIDPQAVRVHASTYHWLAALGSPGPYPMVSRVHETRAERPGSATGDLVLVIQHEGVLMPGVPSERHERRDADDELLQVP